MSLGGEGVVAVAGRVHGIGAGTDTGFDPRALEILKRPEPMTVAQMNEALAPLFKKADRATGSKKGAISKHINKIQEALLTGSYEEDSISGLAGNDTLRGLAAAATGPPSGSARSPSSTAGSSTTGAPHRRSPSTPRPASATRWPAHATTRCCSTRPSATTRSARPLRRASQRATSVHRNAFAA